MTKDGASLAVSVVSFLSRNLRRADLPGDGWLHYCMSSYQMACEALVALGQANEEVWGASGIAQPHLPIDLPRWDDIAFVIISLSEQEGLITFPPIDRPRIFGRNLTFQIAGGPASFKANVSESAGLGAAFVAPDVLPVFQDVGLVAEGVWTPEAETVFWRCSPEAWGLNFTTDRRFTEAVEVAVAEIPPDIREHMAELVTITDADVADAISRQNAWYEKARAIYGPEAKLHITPEDKVPRSIEFQRVNELDWIFFRRWRLDDAWLPERCGRRALDIFHDHLAIKMRRRVLARLYPAVRFASEGL